MDVIDETTIQREKLMEVTRLEHDVQLIQDIIHDFSNIVAERNEKINSIEEHFLESDNQIIWANNSLYDSIRTRVNTVEFKSSVAVTGLLCVNLPIGLAYGLNIALTSSVITSLCAGYWIIKN